MKMDAIQRPFFVYGTLLPGQPNSRFWLGSELWLVTAQFSGGLIYDRGQYPMMVETGNRIVTGKLILIKPAVYAELIVKLDRLEGVGNPTGGKSLFHRLVRQVKTEDGRFFDAWIYLGAAEYVANLAPIPGGDWAQYIAANPSPPWWAGLPGLAE